MNKKQIFSILKPTVFFAFSVYLIMSFVEIDIDFKNWSEQARVFFAVFGLAIPFVTCSIFIVAKDIDI